MIEILEGIIPYISGLYTLPWILIGFVSTITISKVIKREKIDLVMKKIGLIILYFFIPFLLFRIFLNTKFRKEVVSFAILTTLVLIAMYFIAYLYAKHTSKNLEGEKRNLYIKTVITNQGRSSAFIGGALLAIEAMRVYAAIFMALVGIMLFAIIPYILSRFSKNEIKKIGDVNVLPTYLKIYPWYIIAFVLSALFIQFYTCKGSVDLLGKENDIIMRFYTSITIPIALYYVGASINPKDLKPSEIKNLIGINKDPSEHWIWIRRMFLLTMVVTPIFIGSISGILTLTSFISVPAFAVILINSFLPVTSTNMFLVPYGIDKRSTAYVVTWTTIVGIVIVISLITFFEILF